MTHYFVEEIHTLYFLRCVVVDLSITNAEGRGLIGMYHFVFLQRALKVFSVDLFPTACTTIKDYIVIYLILGYLPGTA